MERIELIEYGLNCPEIVISDTELINCIKQLNDGEELWYRDYDNTGEECISLYHCIRRITISEQSYYLFTMAMSENDPFAQDVILVGANIPTTYSEEDPELIDTCQDYALMDALRGFCEWSDYRGMMCIEKTAYEKYRHVIECIGD